MKNAKKRPGVALCVETLERRDLLAAAALLPTPQLISRESFDSTSTGSLTQGWSQWTNHGSFAVKRGEGTGYSAGFNTTSVSGQLARAWYNTPQSSNVQASVNVHLDTLIPAQLLLRGSDLSSEVPNYYAVSVARGMTLKITRTVDGVSTTLGQIKSNTYVSGQWVRVTFNARDVNVSGQSRRQLLEATVQRLDTNQYLNARGDWVSGPTVALTVNDYSAGAILSGGQVGLAQTDRYPGTVSFDDFRINSLSSTGVVGSALYQQTFETTAAEELPADWSQWSNMGPFATTTARSVSPSSSLSASGPSGQASRAWMDSPAPADVQVTSAVYLDSLTSGQVLVRGKDLSSSKADYYAASVRRGVEVELLRVVDGVATTLGRIQSATYLSGQWVQVTIVADGTNLQVQVQRLDNGQFLGANRQWQDTKTSAINVNDTSSQRITGAGQVGYARAADGPNTVLFDNFGAYQVEDAPFNVTLSGMASGSLLSRATTVTVNPVSPATLRQVEFYVDNVRQATDTASPFSFTIDPTRYGDGNHSLSIVAYNSAGAIARETQVFTTRGSTTTTTGQPNIPQHYSWIRLAQLAYSGTPIDATAQRLLQQSVDLVIPNADLVSQIKSLAPNTPQMIYTNVSSIYRELLTDWLNYADANGYGREGAFYHAATPTRFTGDSSSSLPVNYFWGVYQGGSTASYVDLTTAARSNQRAVQFGGVGTSIYVGYTDKFREINFSLATAASRGWKGVIEYATSVNSAGVPTGWTTLTTRSDTTYGLTRSGQILFDPPSNWKTASLNGTDRLYYIRIRTITAGTAPVANTILGRDYVNARGGSTGTIPVFDSNADLNRDGYLSDAEYARRRGGMDARFLYESRIFQGAYGQQRPATNPSNAGFRAWAVDYNQRYLKANPNVSGLFVDNSGGRLLINDANVKETTSTYSNDYGSLLNAIGKAIAPKWVLANTAGGQTDADGVVRQNTAYYEEFAIRALASNYQQFEDLAAQVQHRAGLKNPTTLAILDSLPTGGSPTDPRTQIATLAYYYLLADPKTTFLNFFGGAEPATSWSRHWSEAVKVNVGQPLGEWSLFASGSDPSNRAFTYKVYQRSYSNALVLYKPLSYNRTGSQSGSLGSATATTHQLNGAYRIVNANGTLSAPVTQITLKNGEGAILIRANATV